MKCFDVSTKIQFDRRLSADWCTMAPLSIFAAKTDSFISYTLLIRESTIFTCLSCSLHAVACFFLDVRAKIQCKTEFVAHHNEN